jgi:hypothetical protein
MNTENHTQAVEGVDPEAVDQQIAELDHRSLAGEEPRPAAAHARSLAEAVGYPPLCAHGMNSATDRGYDLALARLRRG